MSGEHDMVSYPTAAPPNTASRMTRRIWRMERRAEPGAASPQKLPERQYADIVKLFDEYAKAARSTALKNRSRGDHFGEELASARAGVYANAADLARQYPAEQAVKLMINNAKSTYVRTPPLANFDRAGLDYMVARAWQFCALQIDPDVPQVAPAWEN